jgi:hypothetical protein
MDSERDLGIGMYVELEHGSNLQYCENGVRLKGSNGSENVWGGTWVEVFVGETAQNPATDAGVGITVIFRSVLRMEMFEGQTSRIVCKEEASKSEVSVGIFQG